jgi:transcriptional repressor NrdR
MRCPFCAHAEDKVVDSREGKNGTTIRRRRECLACGRRFTTYEQIEEVYPLVVKKDGRREAFDRQKIKTGLVKACEKRNISAQDIDEAIMNLENEIMELGDREIPSTEIGERLMSILRKLDDVAYVRFASVYRQFKDITEFMDELKDILDHHNNKGRG